MRQEIHTCTHVEVILAELEISLKKWSDKMSKHLHFCSAISQIWSDVQNNCSLAKEVNLVMFVIVILSKLDSFSPFNFILLYMYTYYTIVL